MLDELWVQHRLESPLFGGLMQATELLVRALRADVVATRIYEGPPHAPPAYCATCRRRPLRPEQEPPLQQWPLRHDSLFALLADRPVPRDVFDPHQVVGPPHEDHYPPVGEWGTVVDSVGLSIELTGGAWCIHLLLRCGDAPAFGDDQRQALRRLQAPLGQTMLRSLRHELCRPRQDMATPPSLIDGATLDVFGRLSRTERDVLQHLRRDLTEREIAHRLDRSPHTVHVHVKSIYRKLAVRSRKELMRLCEQS